MLEKRQCGGRGTRVGLMDALACTDRVEAEGRRSAARVVRGLMGVGCAIEYEESGEGP